MAQRKRHQDLLFRLPHFQLLAVAQVAKLQTEAEIQREFGMRRIETRIMCMVGSVDTCPFQVLTTYGPFDKGHASRTVAALVAKGLMVNEPDMEDQRAILLRLTTAGQRLYREIIASAVRRNERWLAALRADERNGLKRALSTLYRASAASGAEEYREICRQSAEQRSTTKRRTRK